MRIRFSHGDGIPLWSLKLFNRVEACTLLAQPGYHATDHDGVTLHVQRAKAKALVVACCFTYNVECRLRSAQVPGVSGLLE